VEAQFEAKPPIRTSRKSSRNRRHLLNSTEACASIPSCSEILRKVIPTGDNKFSALNSAVSPAFVHLRAERRESRAAVAGLLPHQWENFGQFERTLIIATKARRCLHGGCNRAEIHDSTLHSAVVELVALKGAKIQYITVQNWRTTCSISPSAVSRTRYQMDRLQHRQPAYDEISGSLLKANGPPVTISIAHANDASTRNRREMVHAANNTTSNTSRIHLVARAQHVPRGVVHIPSI